MKNYFDLNKRAAAGSRVNLNLPSLPSLAVHSDGLEANQELPRLAAPAEIPAASADPIETAAAILSPHPTQPQLKKMPFAEQLLMYIGILIGVVFSSAVQQFKSGSTINLNITIGSLLVAAIVALAIMPLIFEKLNVRPDAPLLVRFGLFVQNGVFWHVLFGSIGKIISTTAINTG